MNPIIPENIPVKLSLIDNIKECIHNIFRRKFVVILISYLPRFLCLKKYKELALLILKCHRIFERKPLFIPKFENQVYGGDKVQTLFELEKALPHFNPQSTTILLEKMDSLTAARHVKKNHVAKDQVRVVSKGLANKEGDWVESVERVGIVSFANRRQPGGVGLAPYGGSQEEFLIRRSNLAWALDPRFSNEVHDLMHQQRRKEGFADEHFTHHIPYYGTVVTKDVTFIDQESGEVYDVISAAAPDLRKNSDESQVFRKLPKEQAELARKQVLEFKIRAIFASAAAAKIDHVIFGAFGTGCFLNNVKEVAEITNQVMQSDTYKNRFKTITIALTEDKYDLYNKIIKRD